MKQLFPDRRARSSVAPRAAARVRPHAPAVPSGGHSANRPRAGQALRAPSARVPAVAPGERGRSAETATAWKRSRICGRLFERACFRGGASGRATSLKKSKKDAANRIAASWRHGRGSSATRETSFRASFTSFDPIVDLSLRSPRAPHSPPRVGVSDRESDRLAPRAPRRHSVFRAARRIAPPSSGVSLEPGRAGVTTPRK